MPEMPTERAVTIAGPHRSVDLRVPAGVPLADLLPQVARTVGVPQGESGWELVPIGGDALPLAATLADAAVGDGDVLHLRARWPERRVPDVRSVRDVMSEAPASRGQDPPLGAGLVTSLMTAAVVVPLAAVGWGFTSAVDPTATPDGMSRATPSVAFLVGALLLALLGGWVAVREVDRGTATDGTPAPRTTVRIAAGLAGIVWVGIAGSALVTLAMPAPPGEVVVTTAVVTAFSAAVVGGVWAVRRGGSREGWAAVGCGGYGLVTTAGAAVLAVPLGSDAAARLVVVAAPLTVGALPALAVTLGGVTRLDRAAAGAGVSAKSAAGSAERAAAILRGTLVGAVLVTTLAAASRWSHAVPVDLAVVGAGSLLFALRARTLGRRFAAIPILGAATMAMIAITLAAVDAPVDRLVTTVAAVVVVLGAVQVVLDRRGPASPAVAAHGARLARWAERALVVLVVPLAVGAVDALVTMAAGP